MCSNGCDCENIQLPIPEDGVSITNVTVDSSNQLIVTLSNGTTINAGTINISGTNTAYILHNDNTAETTDVYTPGTPTTIGTKFYAVPANTLSTDGSELRIVAWLNTTFLDMDNSQVFGIYINGSYFSTTITRDADVFWDGGHTFSIKLETTITRVGNTSIAVTQQGFVYNHKGYLKYDFSRGDHTLDPASLGSFNFTTNPINLTVRAQSFSPTNISVTCDKFTVEYIKKI